MHYRVLQTFVICLIKLYSLEYEMHYEALGNLVIHLKSKDGSMISIVCFFSNLK